jgi:predicted nucleic acid-binding protein
MSRIFADSFYFFALLNPNDAAHERAVQFSNQHRRTAVDNGLGAHRIGRRLARTAQRHLFRQVLRDLESNPDHKIVLHDEMLFRKGIDLYDARPDKEWSLTDCISFVVMQDEIVNDALTGDQHYEQAGFRALLK